MKIHARSLRYFDTIRRSGSIREAARRLHVASSAINRQLLALEAELGTPLFDRSPQGLRLTAAGELFSRHVINVLQDEQRLAHELDALRGLRRGEIRIVSVEGLNAEFLPTVLERMISRYPAIKLHLSSGGSAQVARELTNGEADVAIAFSLERNEALRQWAVGRFALGAIMRPDHPLAAQTQLGFADCARHPLILAGPQLSVHAQMKPLLASHRKPLTVVLESASIELARNLAIRGAGIAFQTRLGIEHDLREGRLVHRPLKPLSRLQAELGVYVRAARMLPPALDAFIRIVADELDLRAAQEQTTTGC